MSRPPLYWIEFFVRLPFDCGLDGRLLKRGEIDLAAETLGRVAGWEDKTIDPATGAPEFPGEGVWPFSLLFFRRIRTRTVSSLDDLEQGFPDELSGKRRRWLSRMGQKLRRPQREVTARTVVRMCRVASPPDLPLSEEWIEEQFETCFEHLNDVLTAIAVVDGGHSALPVDPLALDPLVPGWQVNAGNALLGLPVERKAFVLAVNPRVPSTGRDLSDASIDQMLRLLPDPNLRRPFLPLMGYLVGAHAALQRGQTVQGIVDASTSIELLVNLVISEVGPKRDERRYSANKITTILDDAPFRSRLVDHYAPLLGLDNDVESTEQPIGNWWQTGYQLRNRVVHHGHRPSSKEGLRAWRAASGLVEATGSCLAEDPDVPGLADAWWKEFPGDAAPESGTSSP